METEAFQPTIIDLSVRKIAARNGETVTLCDIESNVEFAFTGEGCSEMKGTYSLGRVVKPYQPLQLDLGDFCLILVNCGDHLGCFSVAHAVPEDPTYMTKVIVGDEVLTVKPSDISRDQKAAFDFVWFDKMHRLRIETIPNIHVFYEQSLAAGWRQREEEQKGE